MLSPIKKLLKRVKTKNNNRHRARFLSNIAKADFDFMSEFEQYLRESKSDVTLSQISFSSSEKAWATVKAPLTELFPGIQDFNESDYFLLNRDIEKAVDKEQFASGFEHYLKCGLREIFLGQRPLNISFNQTVSDKFFVLAEPLFDSDLYIQSVNRTLNDKLDYKNAWQHFRTVGCPLVLSGDLELYPNAGLFNSYAYINSFRDVAGPLLLGSFATPFEHFFFHGAKEIVAGRRLYSKTSNVYFYVRPKFSSEIQSDLESFTFQPLISVVMPVYNVSPTWLMKAYESLKEQWYTNWELCICDDGSTNESTIEYLKSLQNEKNVKVQFSKKNQNISLASNLALDLAEGEFIALMDNDDELTKDALYEVVKALQCEDFDFIYSDEDKLELSGEFTDVHFKPDFSPDMFMCHNYLSHLGVIRRSLVEKVGGWRPGYEGAQDYDLYLRVLELTNKIAHIPKVLYHWRKIPGSTAAEFSEKNYAQEAGRKALEDALERRNIDGIVVNGNTPGTYRVKYSIINEPKVSIIIPFYNKPELLTQCLDSIIKYSKKYNNYEVICVNNNSDDEAIDELITYYTSNFHRIRFVEFNEPFNYSRINNEAVKHYATGDYLLFMNNDIELIDNEWLVGLLEHCQRKEVGAVGAKLLYPNDKIQHAGLVLAPETGHAIINVFKNQDADYPSYFARLHSICNYAAVTAALMMVSRADFDAVSGFDEENLAIAYNDVDFCLKLMDLGKSNVYSPYVTAYHHESASRGLDDNFEKLNRQRKELFAMRTMRRKYFTKNDKYYSPNLNQFSEDFMVNKANSTDYQKVKPRDFYENILYEKKYREFSKPTLTIFSHYDKDKFIDPYVVEYLKRLSKFTDIVFVSTACDYSESNLEKIKNYVNFVLVKENVGYDFGAWRTGLLRFYDRLDVIENLIICNDSVYGPMSKSFDPIDVLKKRKLDAIAITDSFEIQYHLQSYFIAMNKKVITSDMFKSFWSDMKIFEDKTTLILNHELGFSRMLSEIGASLGAVAPAERIGYVNNSHIQWDKCLFDFDSNFIKIELLRDNPCEVNLEGFESKISKTFSYPISLINDHLQRFK
ncbi:glycosyltransferase [Paraglaciecola sp.]|uniref:glycosyltransferase n=1 Tax=Paraglaciecola sp. TaxID=1920173 RepID=UPI00273FE682|nr:glycosyltransferase [Paraglaciecola sp.]MDP5031855.1 glycosyltransferase [Paraglaciecola sp.]